MAVTITGDLNYRQTFQDALDEAAEQGVRAAALNAYGDLVVATPRDTGRAANSWTVGYTRSFNSSGTGQARLEPQPEPRPIYLSNGVPYIVRLNEGHSRQAGPNFIENVLLNHFDVVGQGEET